LARKIKIIVVEDERIVAKDIQNNLKLLGYDVPAIVSTGLEALEKTKEHKPDLLLVDIVLKGNMDGIELAKQVKSLYKIPIIYLTAYEDEDTLNRAKLTEPLGYILKPYDERDLHTTLEMALYKHEMEAKLLDSEQRYRMLVEHSPDGIAIQVEDKIIFMNSSAAKLLGESGSENLLGRSIMDFIPEENIDLTKQKIQYVSEHRSTLPFIEEKLIKTDGCKLDVEAAFIPLYYEGKPATQIIFRDITERKQAEEELKEAYSELKKTQQALINNEKLAALGRFSAGIAHEIRNPLANISASAQFCVSKYDIDANMKKHFEVILRNTENANRIIRELLDFTSPREMTFTTGNLGEVLSHVCELVKPRCTKNHINLMKKVPIVLPEFPMNAKKLEEAFMNFLSNAIEAMPEGGDLTIDTYFSKRDNEIVVLFQDTGSGIDKDDIDKVLEPFYTTKDHGTGLGLSLAYNIINKHSGKLFIDSSKGNGTRIQLVFPLKVLQEVKE
jgi:two-component system cell cycle sensor histidine kinase/response regulator CckA